MKKPSSFFLLLIFFSNYDMREMMKHFLKFGIVKIGKKKFHFSKKGIDLKSVK